MRLRTSRLFLATLIAAAGIAAIAAPATAAPRGGGFAAGGFRGGFVGSLGAGPRLGGSGFRRPAGAFTTRFTRKHGYSGWRGGRFRDHRFGRRFGPGFGWPLAYGYGWWGDGYGAPSAPVLQNVEPEWPRSIGIPASPVQPPALYVIGGNGKQAASASRPRVRSAAAPTSGAEASGKLASGPVFIRVPSGR